MWIRFHESSIMVLDRDNKANNKEKYILAQRRSLSFEAIFGN